jgi:nucleolar protein 14
MVIAMNPKKRKDLPLSSSNIKKPNPFDTFANGKKKHDVLNRKVKGENRNVGKALSKSIEIRKKTLLSDYQKNKKSTTFIDR